MGILEFLMIEEWKEIPEMLKKIRFYTTSTSTNEEW